MLQFKEGSQWSARRTLCKFLVSDLGAQAVGTARQHHCTIIDSPTFATLHPGNQAWSFTNPGSPLSGTSRNTARTGIQETLVFGLQLSGHNPSLHPNNTGERCSSLFFEQNPLDDQLSTRCTRQRIPCHRHPWMNSLKSSVQHWRTTSEKHQSLSNYALIFESHHSTSQQKVSPVMKA